MGTNDLDLHYVDQHMYDSVNNTFITHVRRTCAMYGVHGRDGHADGACRWRRRRRRREARVGREWSRDWLKERQSEKGMEEFVVTELAADLGEFPFPYTS